MPQQMRMLLSVAGGVLLGLSIGAAHQAWAAKAALPWREARLFAEVFERVRGNYIDEIAESRLAESAVRGMMRDLDPYSAYLDAKEVEELRVNTSGEYAGVGVEISLQAGRLDVIAAIEGSPAAHAGVRAGDVIVAVDGVAVDPARLNESVERMRGRPGTRVKLAVTRAGQPSPLSFELARGTVLVHSVKHQSLAPGYGYVRINQFSESTAVDFSAALSELQRAEANSLRGLVLDLRNNPGGVLEAATEVADALLDKGVIVTAEGRGSNARFAAQAQSGDALRGAPIVVLVNGGSASAAEIVAAALKDNKRATLIGQRTYGKGSVQTVMPLSDGGALKLTTSLYHTPSGASIHQRGIVPDTVTSVDAAAAPADAQVAAQATALVRDDGEIRLALAKLRDLSARASN